MHVHQNDHRAALGDAVGVARIGNHVDGVVARSHVLEIAIERHRQVVGRRIEALEDVIAWFEDRPAAGVIEAVAPKAVDVARDRAALEVDHSYDGNICRLPNRDGDGLLQNDGWGVTFGNGDGIRVAAKCPRHSDRTCRPDAHQIWGCRDCGCACQGGHQNGHNDQLPEFHWRVESLFHAFSFIDKKKYQ